MKKLLFDGQATQGTSHAKFHGGGEYAKFVLREAISRKYKFDVVFSNRLITDPDIEDLLEQNPQYQTFEVTDKTLLYKLIDEHDYDIFFSPLPYLYSDYKCKAKLIGVIHGLRAIELPWDEFRYKYYTAFYMRLLGYVISRLPILQQCLKRKHIDESRKLLSIQGARFITVSNHSKYALLNFYPFLNEEDIKVYYSPFSINRGSAMPNKHQEKDYYLMVSGNRYEKNVYRAIMAFDKLFSDGRLVGKRVIVTGCGSQLFWNQLKNKNRFLLLPYVPVSELESLYCSAFCFVYPSLNEGFGYPPLKAMGYGVPVIASSSTSIPEICADAACYFSPTSIDDLCNRILQMEQNEELRLTLSKRGEMRVNMLLDRQQRELNEMFDFIFHKTILNHDTK